MTDMEGIVHVFQAFADPTRLRLLNLLRHEKELCVCDLSAALSEEQPKVSRHLAILRQANLVSVRNEGRWKFYELARKTPKLQRRLLRSLDAVNPLETEDTFGNDQQRLAGLVLRLRCR